ncbi:MAG TPA: hypothetical protein VEI02_10445 [Planctomycetota bacterium]|nr:hypothetical protein [Planctomycetota bacterium]
MTESSKSAAPQSANWESSGPWRPWPSVAAVSAAVVLQAAVLPWSAWRVFPEAGMARVVALFVLSILMGTTGAVLLARARRYVAASATAFVHLSAAAFYGVACLWGAFCS